MGRAHRPSIAYASAAGDADRPSAPAPLSVRLAEQLLDETTELVCAALPEGRITYVNRAWQRALGYTAAEAATMRPVDLVAPEDRARYVETARRLVLGEPIEAFEAVLIAKDGRRVVCRGRAVPEMADGPDGPRCVGTRAVYHDLTALRESEAEHRALLATLPLVVYRVSTEPPYPPLYVSPGVQALGWTYEEWMARPDTWVRALHPDDRERVLRETEAALAAGAPVEYEYRLVAPDGTVRWVHDRGERVPGTDGGAPVWQGVMLDVTARREAEAAVRASEERLALIYNSVSDLMFLLRVEHAEGAGGLVTGYRCESVNDAYLTLAGLSREEFVGHSVDELLAPEAAAQMREQYALAAATGDVLRFDEEVELPTGRLVLETTLTPILDELGACTHLLGVSRDVSARRRAEAALRASEARVRGAVEASLDALFMGDVVRDADGVVTDFTIADCNARAAALWDTTRDALVGRRLSDAFPQVRGQGLFDAFCRVVATGEPHVVEYETADPRARARWVKLQVVRVGDGLAVTVRDVSEQKQVEETLRGLALVDELTGVHNRRGFMALAEREWQRARREGRGVVLAYVDLDDFKAINDTHGHAEGDRALRAVADVLRAAFRGADVIGRMGGDEFAVLSVSGGAAGAGDAPEVAGVERRVRERLAQHLAAANAAARAAGRGYEIAMSVGTACAAGDVADAAASLAALMVEADERLYEAKRTRA